MTTIQEPVCSFYALTLGNMLLTRTEHSAQKSTFPQFSLYVPHVVIGQEISPIKYQNALMSVQGTTCHLLVLALAITGEAQRPEVLAKLFKGRPPKDLHACMQMSLNDPQITARPFGPLPGA